MDTCTCTCKLCVKIIIVIVPYSQTCYCGHSKILTPQDYQSWSHCNIHCILGPKVSRIDRLDFKCTCTCIITCIIIMLMYMYTVHCITKSAHRCILIFIVMSDQGT